VSVLVRGEEGVRVSVLDLVLLTVELREFRSDGLRDLVRSNVNDSVADRVRDGNVIVFVNVSIRVRDGDSVIERVRGGVTVAVCVGGRVGVCVCDGVCVGGGVVVTVRVGLGDRVLVAVRVLLTGGTCVCVVCDTVRLLVSLIGILCASVSTAASSKTIHVLIRCGRHMRPATQQPSDGMASWWLECRFPRVDVVDRSGVYNKVLIGNMTDGRKRAARWLSTPPRRRRRRREAPPPRRARIPPL
jgi:hypothetical protein